MTYSVGIWGATKVGRTTFMVSAPKLAVAEFDVGGLERGSTPKQREGIKVARFPKPVNIATIGHHFNWGLQGYTERWGEFLEWYRMPRTGIIYDPEVETIGIDTATELYELRTDHELQQIQVNKPDRKMLESTEYRSTNNDLKALSQEGKQHGKNMIWVFEERPIYVNDVASQEMEHRGWGGMPYAMDIVLHFAKGPGGRPQADVRQVGVGSADLEGYIIPEPTWAKMVAMIEAAAILKEIGMSLPSDLDDLIELAARQG